MGATSDSGLWFSHDRLTKDEFWNANAAKMRIFESLWFIRGIRRLAEFALNKVPILRKPRSGQITLDAKFFGAYNPSYSGVVSNRLSDRKEGHRLGAFAEKDC
jgi:hypothetical protein